MTRTRTRTFAAAGIIGLALSLSACGGDEDKKKDAGSDNNGDGSSSQVLTADQLRTKANDICRKANADLFKIGSDFGDSPTQAQQKDAITQLVDLIRGEIDDLDALKPPADLTTDYDSMLESVRSATDTIEEQGVDYFKSSANPFKDANAKAKALGLDVCASE